MRFRLPWRRRAAPVAPFAHGAAAPDAAPIRFARFARPLHSGLGDRFGVYLSVAAIAHVTGHVAVCGWSNDPAASKRDYAWRDIADRMRLPAELRILDEAAFRDFAQQHPAPLPEITFDGNALPATEGFDCVYTLAHRTMALAGFPISAEAMARAYRQVGRAWEVQVPYRKRFNARRYVALHLRGSDRWIAPEHRLKHFETHLVLESIPRKLDIVAVSDDAELLDFYKALFPRLIVPKRKHGGLTQDLVDLDIVMRAAAIIQHATEGWSAFSSVPAQAKGVPLLNTAVGGDFNRLDLFAERGGAPPELMPFSEANLRAFLSMLA